MVISTHPTKQKRKQCGLHLYGFTLFSSSPALALGVQTAAPGLDVDHPDAAVVLQYCNSDRGWMVFVHWVCNVHNLYASIFMHFIQILKMQMLPMNAVSCFATIYIGLRGWISNDDLQ